MISDEHDDDIVDVYEENMIEEMKVISEMIEEYNYVGIDTEFPGVVYSLKEYSECFYYETMKMNVDLLKVIQIGISLTNERGEKPKGKSTWQFNMSFDYEIDTCAKDSFSMLCTAGIDFRLLKHRGISYQKFAEYLMTSGLVLNDNIYWISFHGCYDFAYLLKLLLNDPLPEKEEQFTNELMLYFPNHYDIKILLQGNDYYTKGGLNRLIYHLGINRKGKTHQAGSDSSVTIEAFFKLLSNGTIQYENLDYDKNILFGIAQGKDNVETFSYTKFSPSPSMYNQSNTNTNTKTVCNRNVNVNVNIIQMV